MRKGSITFKLTSWYTVFMLVIFLLLLAAVEYSWSLYMLNKAEVTLSDEVTDASENIDTAGNEVILGKTIELYDDNVYISIYDEEGKIVKGKKPAKVSSYPEFEDETIKKIEGDDGKEWYCYDRLFHYDDGDVWIRGLTEDMAGKEVMGYQVKLILLLVPLLIFAAAVGGYIISGKAMKPIKEIAFTAGEIKEGEDLSKRINTEYSYYEVEYLKEAFNGMFDRLETVFESEKRFTSDVSHELRTPLAVISSQSEYALEDREYMPKALEIIKRKSKEMSELISSLLTISRSDNGRLKLELEDVSLSEICMEVKEMEDVIVKEKGINIETDIEENIYVKGDYIMLVRIVVNLLDNAVKYGKGEEGNIWLSLKRKGEYAVLAVRDDGPGIEKEHIDKIWNRFYKASSKEGSTGLGLSMVKSLAGAHGGRCKVESEEGKGAVFTVEIPAIRI